MTENEINVAIAKAMNKNILLCEECSEPLRGPVNLNVSEEWIAARHNLNYCENCRSERTGVLNYCNDLNAMAGAEKWLLSQSMINRSNTPFHTYFHTIHSLCTMPYDQFNKPMQPEHWAVCATARQRAEAFLRTINLWKETK